jgi:DNA (cytosine-5)-methyltransferase 1
LTVRELARIQTFPDNFVFKGSTISQQQQIGNAVPPMMARSIAQCIKIMIDNAIKKAS